MSATDGAYEAPHQHGPDCAWQWPAAEHECLDGYAYTDVCTFCRTAIRWESTEYAQRWVHALSGIPMCTTTVATPPQSAPSQVAP